MGVPSSAGAHWPNQEKAPRVTREAGLVKGPQAAGLDVIAFVDLPVADVPQINAGLTFREALACLEVFASSRRFAGLVVSGFNPDDGDEEGEAAMALVQGLVDAVTGGISRSLGQATSRRPTTWREPTDRP